MRNYLLILIFFIASAFSIGVMQKSMTSFVIEHDSFDRGEYLTYKASYGIFNVGEGNFKIQDHVYRINGKPCYKVDAYGWTSGFIGWLATVDDHWYSYVDTATLLTEVGYRDIIEGRYKLNEVTTYQHDDSLVSVKKLDHETNKFKEPEEFELQSQTRGMLSGFLYFRSHDFNTINRGDTLRMPAFLEDTTYNFEVVMVRREMLKTKAGKFKSVVFRPVMPDNSVFEGEDSILAWFSDDKNKIPLKVQAKMFIGKAGIELTSFEGLKHQPALVPD